MITTLRGALATGAVAAAALGMTPVVAEGDWQGHVLISLLVVWALVAAARAGLAGQLERRPLLALGMPSLAGLVASVVALVVWFGGEGEPLDTVDRGPLATVVGAVSDHVGHVIDLLRDLPVLIAHGSIPIDPAPAIELALVGSAVFVLLIAELLVAGLGMSWGAVLGTVALWSVPLLLVQDVPVASFLVAAACCVAVALVPKNPVARPVLRARLTGGVVIAALLAGGGLAAAHVVVGDSSPQALSWAQLPGLRNAPFNLTTDISVGNDLGQQSDSVAYRYRDTTTASSSTGKDTSIADVGPMRLYTLVDFDGTAWSRDRPRSEPGQASPGVLTNMLATIQPSLSDVTRQVTIEALASSNLPITIEPSQVNADPQPRYDPVYDELVTAADGPRDYILDLAPRHLEPSSLRSRGYESFQSRLGDEYFDVPETSHRDEIRALAQSVVAGAGTQYDKLVALQAYFRDSGAFTYSTTVADTVDGDPVWTFLTTKDGYCVQFATAMLVMARTLDIPARMSVGFLPGEQSSSGDVEVRGDDAHTWPEFFFANYGWVRFEPTPGSHTGDAPSWTEPSATPSQNSTPTPSATPTKPASTPKPSATNATPKPSSTATPGTSPAAASALDPTEWSLLVLTMLVLLAAGFAAVAARRRYLDVHDIETAWGRVLAAAHHAGLTTVDPLTPRQAGEAIAALLAGRSTGDELAAAQKALTSIVSALEERRYAQQSHGTTPLAASSTHQVWPDLPAWTSALVTMLKRRHSDRSSSSGGSTNVP